jgi:hypothetical protein
MMTYSDGTSSKEDSATMTKAIMIMSTTTATITMELTKQRCYHCQQGGRLDELVVVVIVW